MFYLDEANFLGVATEALSAAHETILPDQPMGIPAHTTIQQKQHTKSTLIISLIFVFVWYEVSQTKVHLKYL
jgi:hypothetical protein